LFTIVVAKCGSGGADDAEEVEQVHPKTPHGVFQAVAQEPEEPDVENGHEPIGERAADRGNENVADEAPDLAVLHGFRVEGQQLQEMRVELVENEDQRIESRDDADEVGDGKVAKLSFSVVDPFHVRIGR
jgi:hypothetical protein